MTSTKRLGREPIEYLRFAMAIIFALSALIPNVDSMIVPFLLIYCFSFLIEFGPNTTAFVYPAKVLPVRDRTTRHGIAVATGKVAAS